ncbi:MAG: hypothetical protein ACREM1_21670 [Longimicrobiales bacterium]
MRNLHTRAVTLAILAFSAACATGSAGGRGAGDRNLITRTQLDEHRFTNAYEAVAALRTNWLQTRGTDSFTQPTQVLVYFDDSRLGGIETLRSIAITGISYIRYYDGVAASGRWGLDHGQGVIFVSTRPARGPDAFRSHP